VFSFSPLALSPLSLSRKQVTGLLIFGTGVSPLAICQETILLQNNPSTSRSSFVSRSVALGLVLGKTVRNLPISRSFALNAHV
jgi:hypothetical protein